MSAVNHSQLTRLVRQVRAALSDDLRRKEYEGETPYTRGHCYVASEALWHLLGGPKSSWQPHVLKHQGDTHWFLVGVSAILDPTNDQFETCPDYTARRRAAFLTKKPSKRAQELIRRVRRAA